MAPSVCKKCKKREIICEEYEVKENILIISESACVS
jgi:hypothetical protein